MPKRTKPTEYEMDILKAEAALILLATVRQLAHIHGFSDAEAWSFLRENRFEAIPKEIIDGSSLLICDKLNISKLHAFGWIIGVLWYYLGTEDEEWGRLV